MVLHHRRSSRTSAPLQSWSGHPSTASSNTPKLAASPPPRCRLCAQVRKLLSPQPFFYIVVALHGEMSTSTAPQRALFLSLFPVCSPCSLPRSRTRWPEAERHSTLVTRPDAAMARGQPSSSAASCLCPAPRPRAWPRRVGSACPCSARTSPVPSWSSSPLPCSQSIMAGPPL